MQEMIHFTRKLNSSCRVSLMNHTKFLNCKINIPIWKWRKLTTKDLCTNFWESWLKKKLRDFSNLEVVLIPAMMMNCSRRSNFWCKLGKIREEPPSHPLNLQIRLLPTYMPPISSRMCSNSQLKVDKASRSRQPTSRSQRLTPADQILEREDDELIISLRIQSLLIVILVHTISSLHHQFIALGSKLSKMN